MPLSSSFEDDLVRMEHEYGRLLMGEENCFEEILAMTIVALPKELGTWRESQPPGGEVVSSPICQPL